MSKEKSLAIKWYILKKKTAMETFKRKMKNRLKLCRREDEKAASQAISGGSRFKSH